MPYLPVHLHRLPSLSDGDPVLLTGLYSRHADGAVLTQGDRRLRLIGEPFTALPAEIWGVLFQGQVRRLLVHDARPPGSALPRPEVSPSGQVGDEITLAVQVRSIGHDQMAVTADRQVYLLWGEDLDQRCYLLTGEVRPCP